MDSSISPLPAQGCRSAADIHLSRTLTVVSRLQTILPFLTLTYLAWLTATIFERSAQGPMFHIWLTSFTAAVSIVLWTLLLLKQSQPRAVHIYASLIAALVLINSLVQLYMTADANQLTVLVLLLIGSSYIMLSLRVWSFLLAGPALAGWTIIAALKLPSLSPAYGCFTLVCTVFLCGLALRFRLRQLDQAEEKHIQEELRKAEAKAAHERFELAAKGTHDGLWYWDLKSDVFHFSSSWEALLGYEEGELEAKPGEWFDRVHPGYLEGLQTELASHLQGSTSRFCHEHRLRRRDGSYLWVSARGTAVRNEAGEAVALAGSHRDISLLIEADRRALNDAFHDTLTGLPNRNFLMGRLERLMEQKRMRGDAGPMFALMFLDLDRFKVINDSMGHVVGDQLLVAVAGRLRSCARPEDLVARLGGDEFVVLLENIREPDESVRVGLRIRSALSNPFEIGGREVSTGASVGIVLSREPAEQAQDLLRYADMAMYYAKRQRTGQLQMYDESMHVEATRLCDLQNDLARAVERDQLLLHYQPFVSLTSGRILGVEALLRWQRTQDEMLGPNEFVPLAEEMGIIGDIGEWVLRTACAQNGAWQRAGLPPVRIAVNLSARQLQQKDFPQTVRRVLDETALEASWLELELTESALLSNLDLAPETVRQLTACGIRLSIDDFGTGYSSLNYLREFTFQTLKIDRCFVADIIADRKAAAIATGLITIGHNLGLTVIAEGVERKDQLAFLTSRHCDQVQGFLASRPVPAADLANLLRSGYVLGKLVRGDSAAKRRSLAGNGLAALGDVLELAESRSNLEVPLLSR